MVRMSSSLHSFALAALVSAAAGSSAAALPAYVPEIFAPGVISGPANDADPAFAPDGKLLVFSPTACSWFRVWPKANGRFL